MLGQSRVIYKVLYSTRAGLQNVSQVLYSTRTGLQSVSQVLYRARKGLHSVPRSQQSRSWRIGRRVIIVSALGGGALLLGKLVIPGSESIYDESHARPVGQSSREEEGLPLRYSVPQIEQYFQHRKLEVFERGCQIAGLLIPYLLKLFLWERTIRGKIQEHEGLQARYGKALREILTQLGPCFVKLGQAVSIRPDLLPAPFLFELQKLCDSVPCFPTPLARQMVIEELGVEPSALWEGMEEGDLPVAAASLGQVYKVRLLGEGGALAAVKVQRPDMHYYVLRDLHILRYIARAIQWCRTTLTYSRPYDVKLLDTFGEATLKELDYLNEQSNQVRCKEDLEARMEGKVYIPRVYPQYTTRKVLVTEWIDGPKLASSPPEVIRRLTPVGVECFLVQLLDTGFFHADPHPGNLLVTPDGRLALIDFGLMAAVPVQDTRTMTRTILHLMHGDVPGLVQDAVELGFLPEDVDRDSLTPVLQRVFDSAQLAVANRVKEDGAKKLLRGSGSFPSVDRRRKQFWEVSFDLNKIFFLFPFLVPDYFALITRAMIVLEGIAFTGDPEFDLFRSAYPYSLRRAAAIFGYSTVRELAKGAAMAQLGLAPDVDISIAG